jgi:hypothetical protein
MALLSAGFLWALCIVEIDKEYAQRDCDHHSLNNVDMNIFKKALGMDRRIGQRYYSKEVDDLNGQKPTQNSDESNLPGSWKGYHCDGVDHDRLESIASKSYVESDGRNCDDRTSGSGWNAEDS